MRIVIMCPKFVLGTWIFIRRVHSGEAGVQWLQPHPKKANIWRKLRKKGKNLTKLRKMTNVTIRLWSYRSMNYTVFAIRYTICSPPQTRFCRSLATSLEFVDCSGEQIVSANTVYRIVLCDHSLMQSTKFVVKTDEITW